MNTTGYTTRSDVHSFPVCDELVFFHDLRFELESCLPDCDSVSSWTEERESEMIQLHERYQQLRDRLLGFSKEINEPIERIKSDMLELKDKLANITSDNKSVKKHISSVESTYEKSKAVLHGLTIKIESIEANNAIHEENLILLKTSIDYLTKLEEKPLKN